jgi:hypothetical protein
MSTFYKAEIYLFIDLSESEEKHVSISGTRATHSFNYVETIKDKVFDYLLNTVKLRYGEFYDVIENRIFISIDKRYWSEKILQNIMTLLFIR